MYTPKKSPIKDFRSHDTPRLVFLSWPISAFASFYLYTFATHVGNMLNSDVVELHGRPICFQFDPIF